MRRIFEEALCSRFPGKAVQNLIDAGLMARALPEFLALKGVSQPPQFHPEGDVFTHTMVMLSRMVYPDALLGWSVLLHDIGKPATRTLDPDGRIRFFGHEVKGAEMAEEILRRFNLSEEERKVIVHAIRSHMRFGSVPEMREGKIRNLIAEPHFALELELHRLDCISSHALMGGFNRLLEVLTELPEVPPASVISGRDLLALGMKPGREMGEILKQLAACSNREEALQAAKTMIRD